MKNGKPPLLKELYDNKPGPPPEPVMWRATMPGLHPIQIKVGPCQTWFEARELARLEFTRLIGKPIDAYNITLMAVS